MQVTILVIDNTALIEIATDMFTLIGPGNHLVSQIDRLFQFFRLPGKFAIVFLGDCSPKTARLD